MYKTTLIHIITIFIALCISSSTFAAVKKSSKDCLSLIQIKNEKLNLILDSILNHEMDCDYYRPSLIFSIHIQDINGANFLQIESIGFEKVRIGDDQGYFEYREHLFFVSGAYLEETLFMKTDKKKSFTYYKPHKSGNVESDELILDIIEDDSFSFWIYQYIDGDFIFQEIHTYCE